MGTAPAFASVGEAMDMARAALGYLAAVDATQLAAETQVACLRGLERTDATATAARASFLSAFTTGKGYSADADYSARVWLMHRTGITRGAAASHTAWARRYGTHPRVIAALAARELSESYGRTICQWTDRLPEKYREESDELLVAAAAAGLGLGDLSALFAEMYQRARGDLPDEDPARGFGDRGVRLETTFQGAGVMTGDLTPECAAVVAKVLNALSAPAGNDDDRTRDHPPTRLPEPAAATRGRGGYRGNGRPGRLLARRSAMRWEHPGHGRVPRALRPPRERRRQRRHARPGRPRRAGPRAWRRPRPGLRG